MPSKFLATTNELSFTLLPSKIQGVGVFAAHNIKKGTRLRFFPGKTRFIPHPKKPFNELKQKFLNRYCAEDRKGYFCADDFGKMAIGWFLNHADSPNSFFDEKCNYFTKRNIKKGEEITVDYRPLIHPDDSLTFDDFII